MDRKSLAHELASARADIQVLTKRLDKLQKTEMPRPARLYYACISLLLAAALATLLAVLIHVVNINSTLVSIHNEFGIYGDQSGQ